MFFIKICSYYSVCLLGLAISNKKQMADTPSSINSTVTKINRNSDLYYKMCELVEPYIICFGLYSYTMRPYHDYDNITAFVTNNQSIYQISKNNTWTYCIVEVNEMQKCHKNKIVKYAKYFIMFNVELDEHNMPKSVSLISRINASKFDDVCIVQCQCLMESCRCIKHIDMEYNFVKNGIDKEYKEKNKIVNGHVPPSYKYKKNANDVDTKCNLLSYFELIELETGTNYTHDVTIELKNDILTIELEQDDSRCYDGVCYRIHNKKYLVDC